MTLSYFSPAATRRDLRDDAFSGAFDDLVRGFLVRPVTPAASTRGFKFDVTEDGNQYLVEADLPGLKKDDIKIEIDGAQVSISAEYNAAPVGKDGKESESGVKAQVARVVYRERAAGAVARSFELPAEIDQAAASAKYEDGVLKLVLPKKVAETRKLLPIH